MQNLRSLSFSVLIFMLLKAGYGQERGGNPPSVKWRQISTPVSRIIFSQDLDSTAQRVAAIISSIAGQPEGASTRSRKINIVLQNQTAVSNGYVGLAPFRSEFYLTPPPNSFVLGSLPWPALLAMHEYSHVQQYNHFNVGLSKVMSTVFGDGGQVLANSAAIPDWYFEGDAVFRETSWSRQGRGRLPSFFNGFRSVWREGKDYDWMQLRNGSLNNYVPDHYSLGYMMVAYGRETYGNHFWEKVTKDAASYKGLLYPFQHAVKRHSGISFKAFRQNAMNFFKENLETAPENQARANKERFSDEQYPSFNEHGDLLFIRKSYNKIPVFVLKKRDGSEKIIRTSDFTIDSWFGYGSGKIAYAAYRSDLRWNKKEYNEIRILDLVSGKQKILTQRKRHFSPSVSPDGKAVAAILDDDAKQQRLQIIDIATGKILFEPANTEGWVYTHPQYISDSTIVSAVRNNEGKMSIAEMNLRSNKTTLLLPFTYRVIGFPVMQKDTLYFSCSYINQDELFALTPDQRIWQIEIPDSLNSAGLGKYHPSVHEDQISWHTFTASGNKVRVLPRNNLIFLEVSELSFATLSPVVKLSSLDTSKNLPEGHLSAHFSSSKYPKSFRLFNFHSLIPFISDPDYTLSLEGENILNTLQSSLSASYNRSERYFTTGFSSTFSGFFPLLSGGIHTTWNRHIIRNGKKVMFNQVEPFAAIGIPLNLSRGRSFTFLNAGTQFIFNKSDFTGLYKDSFPGRSYGYLHHYITLTHQIQKAQKQIFPRFAQSLIVRYKTAVHRYSGDQIMLNGNIYFPGIIKNHSLMLNGALLAKDSLRQISFAGNFPFSRGYQGSTFYRMYKWGLNYQLPVAYPDRGLADIIYLLRIRTNLYYDYTAVDDYDKDRQKYRAKFRSAGAEIFFDAKWWNTVLASFGVRYSYLIDRDVFGGNGTDRWEIILPVNIFDR